MACATKLRRTRFAPSPTGPLHLGHAYAALVAHARADPGQFLLRIEDIDQSRCRPHFEAAIYADLAWLGLDWQRPVMHQSARRDSYQTAITTLISLGLCYPCHCSRSDIRAALSAPQEGASGPDGALYPGTCRHRPMAEATAQDAIRLNMARALELLGGVAGLSFTESGASHAGVHQSDEDWLLTSCGDIILSRREMGTSYHLAVVVDDAEQGITEVTRGEDLFDATYVHRLLQALLRLPTPEYYHHKLIRDESGKRLAKRDDARALATLRAEGATPADIRAMLGF